MSSSSESFGGDDGPSPSSPSREMSRTMESDLDSAGSCPGPATSEHHPPKPLTLMDLPVDVIEEIARHTGDSFCYFALANPRFAAISTRLRRYRIEINHICEILQRLVAFNSRNVRALILVNCHSESSLILSLILKCPHLIELNTVNSGLTDPDLVQSINFLSELDTLSCTCPDGPDDTEGAPLPNNHSIKSIYVEHGELAFVFLLKLINSCLKIERLHLVQLPYESLYRNTRRMLPTVTLHSRHLPVDPPISRERWHTLQTVILDTHFCPCYILAERHILSVFQNRTASLDVGNEELFRLGEIVYDRGSFNLSRTYIVRTFEDPVWHHGPPLKLEVEDSSAWCLSGSLPESIASLTTLVELDLSKCHSENRPHIWAPLFQSSVGLKILTVSLCLLINPKRWPRYGRVTRDKVFPFVEALENLKLEKLRCSGSACTLSSTCHFGRSLPNLIGLTHLEELTLIEPPVDEFFLSKIANQSLSCLRIIKIGRRDLDLSELESFFETCKKLRYLKLDWDHLPLHEELLWRYLGHANLSQLCITSRSSESVDLGMVRRYLPKICESLDVLHVHAYGLPNAEHFSLFLTAEIAKINLKRKHNPVQVILSGPSYGVVPNFSGLALCILPIELSSGQVG